MKDNPLVISLLVGLIAVLVIAGVSLLVKVNSLDEAYKKKSAESIALRKNVEDLKGENAKLKQEKGSLESEISGLTSKNEELKNEMAKLEKLKDKLEENLKEELMKKELKGE